MRHPIQLPNYMGCLMEFYTSLTLILYENEFQNPQILMDSLEITKSCLTLGQKVFIKYLKNIFLTQKSYFLVHNEIV
jgi:hypothetical protein